MFAVGCAVSQCGGLLQLCPRVAGEGDSCSVTSHLECDFAL